MQNSIQLGSVEVLGSPSGLVGGNQEKNKAAKYQLTSGGGSPAAKVSKLGFVYCERINSKWC